MSRVIRRKELYVTVLGKSITLIKANNPIGIHTNKIEFLLIVASGIKEDPQIILLGLETQI